MISLNFDLTDNCPTPVAPNFDLESLYVSAISHTQPTVTGVIITLSIIFWTLLLTEQFPTPCQVFKNSLPCHKIFWSARQLSDI